MIHFVGNFLDVMHKWQQNLVGLLIRSGLVGTSTNVWINYFMAQYLGVLLSFEQELKVCSNKNILTHVVE
jgi:hypothetical protein